MLQQDLLDTLFLNRKALADVGGSEAGAGNVHTNTETHHQARATEGGNNRTVTALTMSKEMGGPDGADAEKCPVDHRSREAWMAQARAAQEAQETQAQAQAQTTTPQASKPTSSTWQWPRIPFLSSSTSTTPTKADQSSPQPQQKQEHPRQQIPQQHHAGGVVQNGLGTDRVVSTIPRSQSAGATSSACPVNHETETGADARTGNWVYPSEKMFFDAMKRKGHDTRAGDMKTVVPIHNAVNERAWKEIREWERPYASETYVLCL